MPSKSKSQQRLMDWAAHDPDFAKKKGIDHDVAKEFVEADKEHPNKDLPEKVVKKQVEKPAEGN